MEPKAQNPALKWLLIGCGGIAVIAAAVAVPAAWWLFSGPESGVKLGNEIDSYALKHLESRKLLNPGEEVLAYYDATLAMDGSEAAILTTDRILYFKEDRTTSFRLADVQDVRHRYETLTGDILEVEDVSGKLIKIEIPPLNQGESFKNALLSASSRAKKKGTGN